MLFGIQSQWEKAAEKFNLLITKPDNSQPQRTSSLVPIERFHSVSKRQFILGLLLGVSVSLGTAIPAFRYANSHTRTVASASATFGKTVSVTSTTATEKPAASVPVAATHPASNIGRMAPQHPQRTGPSTVNSKQDASLPVRSQNTAIIPADQQESGPSSPPLRGIAANAVGGTESRTRSSATPQELWSRVQAGNINAALALADLYTRGEGVTANCTQARLLLQMASKKGSAEAGRRLQKLDASSCAASSSEDSKPN